MDPTLNRSGRHHRRRSLGGESISNQKRGIGSLQDNQNLVQRALPERSIIGRNRSENTQGFPINHGRPEGSNWGRHPGFLYPEPQHVQDSELVTRRGMRLPSNLDGPSRHNLPSLNNFPSGPSNSRQKTDTSSILKTDRDFKMASRQTLIESFPPAQRQEQETWAQDQLKQYKGVCIAGYRWKRVEGGYRCKAKVCLVTDELLAEGKGGYYTLCRPFGKSSRNKPQKRHGPFYPGDDKLFGPKLRNPMGYGGGFGGLSGGF